MVPVQLLRAGVRVALGFAALCALAGLASGPGLKDLPQAWHDDAGKQTTLAAHVGRPVVLTMAYASCHRICPATIQALAALETRLEAKGTHADFVVVGYDPKRDDAAAWRHFRTLHHLERANWSFLGGSPEDTARLARELGFEFWNYDEHVMHDSRVVVFDAGGRLVAAANPAKPEWAAVWKD